MKKTILSSCLSVILIFSTTSYCFADADLNNPPTEPTKPQVENYKDNDKIENYNKEAEDYNKKAEEYNKAVDEEYDNSVKEVNEKNAEGQQKQKDSQQAHDEAIIANEAEQNRVDKENAIIDEKNQAGKAEEARSQIEHDNAVKENEEIQKYNKEIDEQYEKDLTQYNTEKEQYDKDLETYNTNMEQYRSDFNEQYNTEVFKTIEEYKNYAEKQNATFEKNKDYHIAAKDKGITDKTNDINNLPEDFNDLEDTENPQTITVISGAVSEATYKVITIALYMVGTDTYYGNEYELEKYGTLCPDNYDSIVQAKWESVTVGENDTVEVMSEANLLPHYSNGGFFNYVNDDYLEGYWYLCSTERGTMDVLDWSWKSKYSQTDFDKNIYVIYTYGWQGKYPVATLPEAPKPVQKGEYKKEIEIPEVTLWENLPYATPVFIEVPKIELWEDLPLPTKRQYLPYVSPMNLFDIPNTIESSVVPPFNDTKEDDSVTEVIVITAPSIISSSTARPQRAITTSNSIETFNDNGTKQIGVRTITDTEPPLATYNNYWALVNLIATLLTFIISIILLLMIIINKRKEEDKTEIHNRIPGRIFSIIVAIVTGFIFLITEDMSLPMILVDKWTILMLILLAIQIIIMILCRHKRKRA